MDLICKKRKFTCNFNMSSGAVCGQAYKLTQHKDSTGHKRCREEKAKEQEDKRVKKKKKKKNISKEAMVASSVAQK